MKIIQEIEEASCVVGIGTAMIRETRPMICPSSSHLLP